MNKHRTAWAASALLALSLALTSCGSDTGSGSDTGDGSAGALSHIHGVGAFQGTLYVATHNGVYTPGPDGRPVLVGTRRDDFMGFTVTTRGSFLASGHPAPGGDGPADLGLIESTDRGATWTTRSLAGEVDFHALDTAAGAAADSTVYGYDATNGRLRASADGVTWEDRAELRALDIAASPAAPGTVLATTERGVVRSTDGGRTFGAPASPRLVAYVSWAAPDALFGVDPQGVLLRSTDAGGTWSRVGTVPGGAPQALTAVDSRRVLAATRDGVYESADGGRTFVRRMAVTTGGDGH
ncbi:F510_1955 family glycosylhydrolase [Streptomyces sp. NPDC004267]|uniref:F510_1955 family glycosylhydrolase n=1 Tax=Streptomyces sp. NPDC004267 TaxID=3364694 RepID=UPI00367A5DD2